MAKYRINTPAPGSYIEKLGIVEPGTEIELPDDYEPRNSWLPLDAAALKAFAARNERVIAKAKQDAEDAGEPLTDAQVKALALKLRHDGDRTPQLKNIETKTVKAGKVSKAAKPASKAKGKPAKVAKVTKAAEPAKPAKGPRASDSD